MKPDREPDFKTERTTDHYPMSVWVSESIFIVHKHDRDTVLEKYSSYSLGSFDAEQFVEYVMNGKLVRHKNDIEIITSYLAEEILLKD